MQKIIGLFEAEFYPGWLIDAEAHPLNFSTMGDFLVVARSIYQDPGLSNCRAVMALAGMPENWNAPNGRIITPHTFRAINGPERLSVLGDMRRHLEGLRVCGKEILKDAPAAKPA